MVQEVNHQEAVNQEEEGISQEDVVKAEATKFNVTNVGNWDIYHGIIQKIILQAKEEKIYQKRKKKM